MALAPRYDDMVWVGTVTWTSSKPVELVVLHVISQSVTPDATHGAALTAPFGKGAIAIILISPSATTVLLFFCFYYYRWAEEDG
jgi:hypothetical protein